MSGTEISEGVADVAGKAANSAGVSYIVLAKHPESQQIALEAGGPEKDALVSFFMQWVLSQAAKHLPKKEG